VGTAKRKTATTQHTGPPKTLACNIKLTKPEKPRNKGETRKGKKADNVRKANAKIR
jgi:hypothetical protein